jgi:pentatricopeptide repeat protein
MASVTAPPNLPTFFRTDLLNLVVNHWRKAMSFSPDDDPFLLHDTKDSTDETSTRSMVHRSRMHPRSVLDRLYRYQETSPCLQPDRQTYSMVIDGIASLVATTAFATISDHCPSSSSSSENATMGSDSAPEIVVADSGGNINDRKNEDIMPMVGEIIEWLVQLSTKDVDDHDQDTSQQIDKFKPSSASSRSPSPHEARRSATMSPNVVIFSSAMNAWAKSGRTEAPTKVEGLLQQMKALHGEHPSWGVAPNGVTYTTAIDAWAKVGRVDKVRDLLSEMHEEYHRTGGDSSLKPGLPAFNGYLVALSKCGSTDEAEDLLTQMEDLHESGELEECPNVISYSAVVDGFSRSREEGASNRAEVFLRRMIERHGIASPNAVTYNSVINAHAQAGDILAAERLLSEMHETYLTGQNAAVRPTLKTYSTVLSGLAKSRRPDSGERAEKILDLVKQMANSGDLEEAPDVVMYNIVLDCWAKSPVHEASMRSKLFLERMIDDSISPDVISYNTVIHCMTRSGSPHEAEALFEDMKAAGVHPNQITYNTLLAAYLTSPKAPRPRAPKESKTTFDASKVVDTSKAEQLFARMKNDPHVKLDVVTYNTMLHFYSRTGDVAKAEEFLAEMLKEDAPVSPDSVSMNTVINAWSNSGRADAPQRAEGILDKMLASTSEGEGRFRLCPTSITFNSVMNAWTKSGKSEAPERCQRLFRLMNDLVDQGHVQARPDFVTYNTLIHAWSLASIEDAPDRAEAVFLEMKHKYDAGNARMRPTARTYGALIHVWSKSKRPNSGDKAEGYLRSIIQISESGKRRRPTPRQRKDLAAPRVYEFTATIRAWANSGDPRAPYKADEILYLLMQQIRQGNELALPDAALFGTILTTLAQSKVPNKALYADKIVQMMKAYKIPPNRNLLLGVQKCYEESTVKKRLH